MKTGIVICSRYSSSRVPGKSVREINGKPLILHLIQRLLQTGLPIVLAVPPGEAEIFESAIGLPTVRLIHILEAHADCPLARMTDAAHWLGLDTVVRVCTDKIFVDPKSVERAVDVFKHSEIDYLYSSTFVPGSGFEVIRYSTLYEAAEKFRDVNVEHISYAVRAVTPAHRICDLVSGSEVTQHRLLIDHQEDVRLIEEILRANGNACSLYQALRFLDANPGISEWNRLPRLTVYTCAFNTEPKFLVDAFRSIERQRGIDFEYIVVDDGSSKDSTREALQLYAKHNPLRHSVQYIRNQENLGLASSSNIALSRARGEYIIRLDADDYFIDGDALVTMVKAIDGSPFDAIYPSHYRGSLVEVGSSREHHVGGAIFRTKALNFVRFTDGIRQLDSYDLYKRSVQKLRLGYLTRPIFFYRQHAASLSKQNPGERAKLKAEIDQREEMPR